MVLRRWLTNRNHQFAFPLPGRPPMPSEKVRILFVCTGNICRSPTAVGVMRKLVQEAGLQHRVTIDSAGTHDYCVGKPPHPQAQAVAQRRGYDLASIRARQLAATDFESFDLLLAMDRQNFSLLRGIASERQQPKISLLMNYARESSLTVIPDPYGRKPADFEMALNCIEDACSGLLDVLSQQDVVAL